MNLSSLIQQHLDFLKTEPEVYFSPGRVNLIGEHVDYLGGRVFPTAIDLGTYAFVTPRTDNEFHFLSHNFRMAGKKVAYLDQMQYDKERNWANYLTGMIQAFAHHGADISHGINVLIYGTLPNGAGLSSSASLEVLMGIVLEDQYHHSIDRIELVQMAQSVENQYIGVNCGIMDQFAVGMGQQGKAIYLDTNTLDYEMVPLAIGDHVLVIGNTNKKRALSDSKYNERRAECDEGLRIVQGLYPVVKQLCELSLEQYWSIEDMFVFEPIRKRVRHAVTENDRTRKAVSALLSGNLEIFGQLMIESHESLKNDYEVSCFELDVLVDSFLKNGAIGARMTGAGFGGCAIALMPYGQLDNILPLIQVEYRERTSSEATFYICHTSDGSRKLNKEELV